MLREEGVLGLGEEQVMLLSFLYSYGAVWWGGKHVITFSSP